MREKKSRSGTPWRARRRVRIVRVRRPGLRELPKRVIALLGKRSDQELAQKAGVHLNTILHERHRRGIPPLHPVRPPTRWTASMIRKLGTATDREVAAELGLTASIVAWRRRILGIPPFRGRASGGRPGYPWQSEELAMLGKVSDRRLARELGLSTGSVALKRLSLGIPAWRPRPPRVRWTKEMLRLVGKVSDEEVARRFGISGSSVIQKRRRLGLPPLLERRPVEHTREPLEALRLPMTEVRRRTGLNTNSILALQKRYGIRPLRHSHFRYPPTIVARMGKEPDAAIARDIGASDSAVRQQRHNLGIPSYASRRRRRRPKKGARSRLRRE